MPKKLQKRLQDYLTKIKKPSSQIQFPSKKWIRTCKHTKTLSFAINRDSNEAHQDKDDDAATLSDIDEFLFENFRSLYLRDDQGGTTTDVDDEIKEVKGLLPPPPCHASFRDKTLFIKESRHHENETFWDKTLHTNSKKQRPDDYRETQSDGFMLESPRLNIDPPAADLCGSHRFSVSPGRLSSSVRTSTTSEDAGSTSMSSHSNKNNNNDHDHDHDHMQQAAKDLDVPLPSDCISVLMYSPNPCDDFRRSMQDMVEARIKNKENVDWNFMEELLFCYLNLNEKKSHKFILSAFADLVVEIPTELRRDS